MKQLALALNSLFVPQPVSNDDEIDFRPQDLREWAHRVLEEARDGFVIYLCPRTGADDLFALPRDVFNALCDRLQEPRRRNFITGDDAHAAVEHRVYALLLAAEILETS